MRVLSSWTQSLSLCTCNADGSCWNGNPHAQSWVPLSHHVLFVVAARLPPVTENVLSRARLSEVCVPKSMTQPRIVTPAGSVSVAFTSTLDELGPIQLRTSSDCTLLTTPPAVELFTRVSCQNGMPVKSTLPWKRSVRMMRLPSTVLSGASTRMGNGSH